MIAERSFPDQFIRIDPALNDNLGVGGHFHRDRFARDEFDAFAIKKTCEQQLADIGRERAGGCIRKHRFTAEDDRHRHLGVAAGFVASKVGGAIVMNVPMHRRALFVHDLHAVHADVALAVVGVERVDAGHRDVATGAFLGVSGAAAITALAIVGPTLNDGQVEEAGVVGLDDLLTDARLTNFRTDARELGQFGEFLHLGHQRRRHLGFDERLDAFGQRFETRHAEALAHSLVAAEDIDRAGDVGTLHVFKE